MAADTTFIERYGWLSATDSELQRQCRIDVFTGSGHGGQKRNKTASAVRATHKATGITGQSDDTRSQHRNKALALHALRHAIALHCRVFPEPYKGVWAPALSNDAYPHWLAAVLDQLAACDWHVSVAATALDQSTNALIKSLIRDSQAWQVINTQRQKTGLKGLKAR